MAAGDPPEALVPAALVCCVMWVGARTVSLVVSALGAQREELRAVSQVDPLTGVLNRRSLFDAADALAARGRSFAVVLVDLDGFKAVNDTRGHLFGDEVLRRAARAMREAVRREDLVARYGGDEFAVLVPGGRAEGELVLRRLKEAVLTVARELGAETSLSGGVAVWPDEGAAVEDVLRVADRRLYAAKNGGTAAVLRDDGAALPASGGV
jgi:diguanylate cyclase (GGDEF)-like protein